MPSAKKFGNGPKALGWTAWALCLLPWLLAGCGPAPHEAGVLRLAQESDASTLDPARSYDTTSITFSRLLYRGLVDYDAKANIVNEVAKSRVVSKDGKTYTFTLRDDVYFHSGRRVVAADFRYALERVLDPATASDGLTQYRMIVGAEDFSAEKQVLQEAARTHKPAPAVKHPHVSGIEVLGDDVIIFRLNSADATFLNYLTLPFAYAVPKEWVEELASKDLELSEHPNGCGPFKMQEWVHDGWLTLVKNDKYFKPELPAAREIRVRFGLSTTLQSMLFERGEIDIQGISDSFPADFLRMVQDDKWKKLVQHGPMMDIRYVTLNTEMEPFKDKRVRQAVNYAVDRKRITSFLTGRATLARGALPPGMPGYNPNLFRYPHDPAKARALLKAAGYRDNPAAPIPFWYATNEAWYAKAAQAIHGDLKAVGLSVAIKPLRYPDLKTRAGSRGTTQMAMMGWLQDFPDPANFLDVLFNAKSIRPTASLNRAFYSNPKVNALLDAAGVERDWNKRLQMYQDAEKLIVDDAPVLFLHHTERYVVRQPWVKGFRLHPMWSAVYENVSIAP